MDRTIPSNTAAVQFNTTYTAGSTSTWPVSVPQKQAIP